MKVLRRVLQTGLLVVVLSTALRAQEPVRVTEQGVIVDFQDADLRLVIAALAEAGKLNVVYGDLPARRITLRMQQPLPLANVLPLLRSLAQSNGLRVVEEESFVRLETAAAPAATDSTVRAARDTVAPKRLYVYRLKHARAPKLGGTLQAIFGGRSTVREGSQNGPPTSLSQGLRSHDYEPLQKALDQPQVTVELGGERPGIAAELRGDIQIVPDEATNALLIRAEAVDWEVVRQAIEALDLRPLQVLIEVLIAEVRNTKDLNLSVSGKVADKKTDPSVRGTLKGVTSGDLVLELLRAGTVDVAAALSLLSSHGDVRIVSRPIVLAQNNQEARILIGSERPFIQVSRSLPTDAAIRDQVIQYRDVGTKLTIVPTINDDGYVNLQVLQEVSSATAETQFDAPVISTREAATHLFIRNGQTAVLGGLIDRQQERTRSGIPILMGLPLIGGLFGTSSHRTVNSELFLFLTPHIIATDEDTDAIRGGIQQGTELLPRMLPTVPAIVPVLPSAHDSGNAGQ
jgi:general secretion pathway protein D